MVSALRQAATDAQLHRVTREGEIEALLAQLMEREWVVYSKACPGRAEQVVDYLGRYSHRIAISDERIVEAEETHVSFRVKDYAREGARRTLTLGDRGVHPPLSAARAAEGADAGAPLRLPGQSVQARERLSGHPGSARGGRSARYRARETMRNPIARRRARGHTER